MGRLRYQLKTLNTNVKGSRATDFSFVLASGSRKSLWKVKSEYTLLLLYNPDCENCQKAVEALSTSSELQRMTRSTGKGVPPLTVLTVAVESDKEVWKRHLSMMPDNWLNGYDEKEVIRESELYDLRSVPSLYLLDKNKRVLVRDANVPEVLNYLLKK